jgi:hypothetical protein
VVVLVVVVVEAHGTRVVLVVEDVVFEVVVVLV